MKNIHWQNVIALMIGAWLFVSPWLLGYFTNGTIPVGAEVWNLLISGAALMILSVMTMLTSQRWEVWIEILLAGWLVISPWLLGFQVESAAVLNLLLSGGIVFITTMWALSKVGHTGER